MGDKNENTNSEQQHKGIFQIDYSVLNAIYHREIKAAGIDMRNPDIEQDINTIMKFLWTRPYPTFYVFVLFFQELSCRKTKTIPVYSTKMDFYEAPQIRLFITDFVTHPDEKDMRIFSRLNARYPDLTFLILKLCYYTVQFFFYTVCGGNLNALEKVKPMVKTVTLKQIRRLKRTGV